VSDRDALDRAIEKLLADRSPRDEAASLDPEQQRMLRMAQLLRGSAPEEPDDDFVAGLHGRLIPASQRVTRRTAFLGALGGLAAGLAAGLGLGHLPLRGSREQHTALVGRDGRWVRVADVSELPHGTIKAFRAGHIQGFLVNSHGAIHALSRICTHMGCQLEFEPAEQSFVCPCHGAEFTLTGKSRYGPGGYAVALPPLPRIKVRTRNRAIEVWAV